MGCVIFRSIVSCVVGCGGTCTCGYMATSLNYQYFIHQLPLLNLVGFEF